jgi:hypothetical protein
MRPDLRLLLILHCVHAALFCGAALDKKPGGVRGGSAGCHRKKYNRALLLRRNGTPCAGNGHLYTPPMAAPA